MKRKRKFFKLFFLIGSLILCAGASFASIYLSALEVGQSADQSGAIVDVINPGTIDEIRIISIHVTPAITIFLGETATIDVSLSPQNTTNTVYNVVSNNEDVIVSNEGIEGNLRIRGLSIGAATLSLSSNEHPNVKTSIVVTVVNNPVLGISVRAQGSTTLFVTSTWQITTTFTPTNASNRRLNYEIIEGNNIVTVNAAGLVRGSNIGSAIIKVSSVENPSIYQLITVVISPGSPSGVTTPPVIMQSFSLLETAPLVYDILIGQTINIPISDITFTPCNSTNRTFRISNYNEEIISVSGMNITGLTTGSTLIHINSNSNPNLAPAIITINVHIVPPSFIYASSINLVVGKQAAFMYIPYHIYHSMSEAQKPARFFTKAPIELFDSNENMILLEVSNESVIFSTVTPRLIRVEENGIITGLRRGLAKVVITSVEHPDVYFILEINIVPYDLNIFMQLSRMVRKGLGHFSLFFGIGATAMLGFGLIFAKKPWYIPFIIALCYTLFFAGMSEFTQWVVTHFFDRRRGPSWDDVLLNSYGAITGVVLVFLGIIIYRLISFVSRQKNLNKIIKE